MEDFDIDKLQKELNSPFGLDTITIHPEWTGRWMELPWQVTPDHLYRLAGMWSDHSRLKLRLTGQLVRLSVYPATRGPALIITTNPTVVSVHRLDADGVSISEPTAYAGLNEYSFGTSHIRRYADQYRLCDDAESAMYALMAPGLPKFDGCWLPDHSWLLQGKNA